MSSQSSSAASGIQGLLLKVHESLSDTDLRSAALKCHDIIGDLGQECMLTSTETDLGKTQMFTWSSPNSIKKITIFNSERFCWELTMKQPEEKAVLWLINSFYSLHTFHSSVDLVAANPRSLALHHRASQLACCVCVSFWSCSWSFVVPSDEILET